MWRQGGFKPFDLKSMDVGGRRPGEPAAAPETDASLDADPPAAIPVKKKKIGASRFNWKPTSRD
jgi:hypothetical protein